LNKKGIKFDAFFAPFNIAVIRNALYKTFVFQIVKKFNQPQKQQKTDLETSWLFYEQI
jgi:hypothetical protein